MNLGTKGVRFMTTNQFGGKNFILSYLYIACGAFSMLVGIIFALKTRFFPEKIPELKFE